MNTTLLQDEVFCVRLAEDLTAFFDINIGSTERLATVWEASKALIREKLIAQSSKRKKENTEQIYKLEAEICILEKDLASNVQKIYIKTCVNINSN